MTEFELEDLECDPDDQGEFEVQEYRPQARTFLEVSGELRRAYSDYLDDIATNSWRSTRIILLAEVISASLPGKDIYLLEGWLKLNASYGEVSLQETNLSEPHYLARGAYFRKLMKEHGMLGQVQQNPVERGPTMIDAYSMFWSDD